jgi:hypothetical protein
MLTYADVCQVVLKDCVDAVLARKIRMLTYADVCQVVLTYADVCQVVLKDCVDAVLARKILDAQHQVTPKALLALLRLY